MSLINNLAQRVWREGIFMFLLFFNLGGYALNIQPHVMYYNLLLTFQF